MITAIENFFTEKITLQKRNYIATLALIIISIFSAFKVIAQRDTSLDDLNKDFQKALKILQAGKYQEAEDAFNAIISKYEAAAKERFGSMFGLMYFQRGSAQLKLKKYELAAKSFQACREKFPNKPDTEANKKNPNYDSALLYWAVAEYHNGDAQKALDLLEKFKAIADKNDTIQYNKNAFYLHYALSLIKSGDSEKNLNLLDKIFANYRQLELRQIDILNCFYTYVNKSIYEKQPQRALKFINRYENQIDFSPYLMSKSGINGQFFNLALQSLQNGQEAEKDQKPIYINLTIKIISLITLDSDFLDRLKGQANANIKFNKSVRGAIKEIEDNIASDKSIDENILSLLLTSYASMKAFHAQFAMAKYMADNFPDSKEHPKYLHTTVVTANTVGDYETSETYGNKFIKKYPEHELRPQVEEFMIVSLFRKGKYDDCLRIGEKIRKAHQPGSKQRMLADFVVGGSYYYKTQNQKAKEELKFYLKHYPKSQQAGAVSYYYSDNFLRLGDFEGAKKNFDIFLSKYPNHALRPHGLQGRALCHYQDGELNEAIEKCKVIEEKYKATSVLPKAQGLHGDALVALGKEKEAIEKYKETYASAQRFKFRPIAEKTLNKLISTCKSVKNFESAANYYDEYFKNYKGGLNDARVAVSGLEALKQVGRLDEGLKNLQESIIRMSSNPEAKEIAAAVNRYVDEIKKEKGPAETIKTLENFPGLQDSKGSLQGIIVGSMIDVLTEELRKAEKGSKEEIAYNAKLSVAKKRIVNEFENNELTNYNLVQKAKFLTELNRKKEANEVYAYLEKKGGDYVDYAVYERAKDLIASGSPDNESQALQMFEKLIKLYKSEKSGLAYLEIARHFTKKQDWETALKKWTEFRDFINSSQQSKLKKGVSIYDKAEGGFFQAYCYEQLKKYNLAVKGYQLNASSYQGIMQYAPMSYYRAVKILESKLNDRAKAYRLAKLAANAYISSNLANHPLDKEKAVQKLIKYRDQHSPEFENK